VPSRPATAPFQMHGIGHIKLPLVHAYQLRGSGRSIRSAWRFADKGDGHMDEMHGLRHRYRAEVAILVVGDADGCGQATRQPFAVVHHACGSNRDSLGPGPYRRALPGTTSPRDSQQWAARRSLRWTHPPPVSGRKLDGARNKHVRRAGASDAKPPRASHFRTDPPTYRRCIRSRCHRERLRPALPTW
jgi:hypothetical protein